ncbi:hypothetical protein MZH75_26105, partial [Escherichia coli]|nr:hypothetical protein [Escherichia coli]
RKLAQIREILISESTWEEMTCLFAPSLAFFKLSKGLFLRLTLRICKFAPRNKLTVITLFAVIWSRRVAICV